MPWKDGVPRLYHIWRGMLDRCYNPSYNQYYDYGGRGIRVCPQWRHDFSCWLNDMGPRPKGMTLDRIDNNGDYTPKNCRWATRKQQQRNQRVTRKVIIEGIHYVAADLAEIAGQKTDTIVERADQGLSYEEVISKERRFSLEGLSLGAKASSIARKAKTHCKYGHAFTPENTYIAIQGKYRVRQCRACRRKVP
jgi:hypothetical protein